MKMEDCMTSIAVKQVNIGHRHHWSSQTLHRYLCMRGESHQGLTLFPPVKRKPNVLSHSVKVCSLEHSMELEDSEDE